MSLWLAAGAIGLACAPLLSIPHTGPGPIALVRDLWLLSLLAVAFAWTLQHEVIFAPMALWFLWRWRSRELLPSLVTWVGIAATWEVARALPPQVIHLLPWAWVGIACVLSGLIIAQRWWGKDERTRAEPYGWLGQRTLASAWLALILPFAPWWALPLLGLDFWLTGPSWIAAGALLVGLPVLYPASEIWIAGAGVPILASLVARITWSKPWKTGQVGADPDKAGSHAAEIRDRDDDPVGSGTAYRPHLVQRSEHLAQVFKAQDWRSQAASYGRTLVRGAARLISVGLEAIWGGQGLLARSPRGNTLDGLWTRLRKYRLIVRYATLAGHGPHTIARQNLRWNTQVSTPENREPIALGEAHCDYLGHIWDYGALGALTILLAAWDIGSRLRWHDPWSAAAVTASVLAVATYPLRVAPIGLTMLTIWATVGR